LRVEFYRAVHKASNKKRVPQGTRFLLLTNA